MSYQIHSPLLPQHRDRDRDNSEPLKMCMDWLDSSVVSVSGCRTRAWEFGSSLYLLQVKPACVAWSKMHNPRAFIEERNGRP